MIESRNRSFLKIKIPLLGSIPGQLNSFAMKSRCRNQEHINNHELIWERNFRTKSQDPFLGTKENKNKQKTTKNEKPTMKKRAECILIHDLHLIYLLSHLFEKQLF